MEKTVDLNLRTIQDVSKVQLQTVNGGMEPVTTTLLIAAISGIAVSWKSICDTVHEAGKEIGAALAK